ncbi:MAG: phage tail tape measure protein, partial [Tannerellaceae bacterium]|nr:phage tail tape measure protein [Tannerellaceae bacterium]
MAVETQTAQLDLLVNGEQAKEELDLLSKKANDLAKKIDEARDAGKHATARQLTKNLKEVNNKTKELKNEIMDVSKVLNNLSTAKPRELDKVLASLRAKLNSGDIKRGSEAWNKYQESIRRVKEEMRKISSESEVAESRLSRLSNGFNKYFAMVTAFVASVTGLSLAARKASEENAKLDDTYSDVMKTTSMTRDEVVALNEEFKKMDTRKSREELNKIAEEAGRIGIAKEDVLEFSKAMNVISVALGDSFKGGVEEIAGVLGKLKFLFKETTDMGVEKAYMSIGSAINDLGANGVATERNIAEFATRMGSMPEALKPPLSSTLALGAALEESGIEAEIASRAYNIFMRQAATNADKFARVMRITTGEVEAMINKDPLEFFLKFSEGLRGMDATDVAKTLAYLGVNADGAIKVLSSAGDKTERFRELIDLSSKSFREGVSAMNEYGIKNNNLQAKLEKSRKAFWEATVALGEHLNPALLKSTDITTYIVRLLPGLIDWFGKYGTTIIKLAAIIGTYVAIKKIAVLWSNQFGLATIMETVALKASTAAIHLHRAALLLLRGHIVNATIAMRKFILALDLNPISAIVAGVAALGIAVYSLVVGLNKLNPYMQAQLEIQQKTNEQYGEQEANINHLINTLNNEKLSIDRRREALLELKKIIPDYHADLTDEGILINNNTEAIKAYLVQLEKQIRIEMIRQELSEFYRKKREQEIEYEKKLSAIESEKKSEFKVTPFMPSYAVPVRDKAFDRLQGIVNRAKKELDETLDAIDKLEKEVQQELEGIGEIITTGNPDENPGGGFLIPGGNEKNAALKEALKKEEERYTQSKADLKKRYAERLETEESF